MTGNQTFCAVGLAAGDMLGLMLEESGIGEQQDRHDKVEHVPRQLDAEQVVHSSAGEFPICEYRDAIFQRNTNAALDQVQGCIVVQSICFDFAGVVFGIGCFHRQG